MMRASVLGAVGIMVAIGGLAGMVAAQTPEGPAFEVASVKRNKSDAGRFGIEAQPSGRLTASNVTLQRRIRDAYQLQDFQLLAPRVGSTPITLTLWPKADACCG